MDGFLCYVDVFGIYRSLLHSVRNERNTYECFAGETFICVTFGAW